MTGWRALVRKVSSRSASSERLLIVSGPSALVASPSAYAPMNCMMYGACCATSMSTDASARETFCAMTSGVSRSVTSNCWRTMSSTGKYGTALA
jgi:hypothetical protein